MSTLGRGFAQDARFGPLLLPDISGQVWREKAACRRFPAQLWDPATERFTVEDKRRWEQAAEVCRSCPVLPECAADVSYLDAGMVRAGFLVTRTGQLAPISGRQSLSKEQARMRGLRLDMDPAECGSDSAKKRHTRRKEMCDVCWPNGKSWTIAKCGTESAKRRHRRNKQSCAECNYTYKDAA